MKISDPRVLTHRSKMAAPDLKEAEEERVEIPLVGQQKLSVELVVSLGSFDGAGLRTLGAVSSI